MHNVTKINVLLQEKIFRIFLGVTATFPLALKARSCQEWQSGHEHESAREQRLNNRASNHIHTTHGTNYVLMLVIITMLSLKKCRIS